MKQQSSNTIEEPTNNSNNINNIINKALKKTTPITKKKSSTKIQNNIIGDSLNNEPTKYPTRDDRYLQRSKSHSNHNYQQLHKPNVRDQEVSNNYTNDLMEINVRRYSTNELNSESLKRNHNTKRLHRSAVALNKNEIDVPDKLEKTPPTNVKNVLRHAKSEVIPLNNTPSTDSSKLERRLCYDKRLKELEEEIERYKNEVKTFCRETFRNTQKQQYASSTEDKCKKNKNYNFKSTPKTSSIANINTNSTTPIKNIYFQLLTKGQHQDCHKSELDLSGNSANGSSSSEQFRNSYNSNSCSGRSKTAIYNITNSGLQQESTHQHLTQKSQSQQRRCRPISKFV